MRYLPMNLRVPGVCPCGAAVIFDGKRWTDGPRKPHRCRLCNAPMRPGGHEGRDLTHDRCARPAGPHLEHRSRYAIENARIMRTGRAA